MSGIDWHGPARQPCPACGRGARDKALSVTHNHDGSAVAYCHRCQYVETLRDERRAAAAAGGKPRKPAPQAPQRHEVLSPYGRELWAACRPVSGPARAYLEARGCVVPPADGDLRWHPALRHPVTGFEGPGLVGLVTHAVSGAPLTLHRTWVRPDGTKAPEANPPRMLLGNHTKREGVIRLWPDEAVTLGLLVGEGIESVLAAARDYTPAWSCIDAGGLETLPPLRGIETLVIAADHDEHGRGEAAALTCAKRWRAASARVYIIAPRKVGTDWAEVAHERG